MRQSSSLPAHGHFYIYIYIYTVRREEINNHNKKILIGATKLNWKDKWCNNNLSFTNRKFADNTTLSKQIVDKSGNRQISHNKIRYCEKKPKRIKELIIAADYVWKINYVSWNMPKTNCCKKTKKKTLKKTHKNKLISKCRYINKCLLCHLPPDYFHHLFSCTWTTRVYIRVSAMYTNTLSRDKLLMT